VTSLWILLGFQVGGSFIEVIELVDELAICLPISFIGRKVYAGGDFGVKVSSSVGPHLQLSISKSKEVV
jgi:hypothetical protein